jgi:hypothetical protein
MARKSSFRLDTPNRKIPCKRTAPRIVWVVETGSRKRVAIKIQIVAPIRTDKMKNESVEFRRILEGVNTVNNLPEIRIAEILPRPLKTPPQSKARRRSLGPPGSAVDMSEATLLPTSFAPLAKARTKRTVRPTSSTNKSGRNTHFEN